MNYEDAPISRFFYSLVRPRLESIVLLYEYRVREEFVRIREYAENVRAKFERNAEPADLLLDARNLRAQYKRLIEMLPDEIPDKTNLGRHLGFMEYWLTRNNRASCASDITDICERDITELEKGFQSWCGSPDHFDSELSLAISDLLAQRELDSAIRKAFVVLKERLCKRFRVPSDLDGIDLVNKIFGKSSDVVKHFGDAERQAMRDLLAGMYGVFRNRFAHSAAEPTWAEADAVISLVNQVLLEVSRIGPKNGAA